MRQDGFRGLADAREEPDAREHGAVCRGCGVEFYFDLGHYTRNGLTPPHSCPPCRRARDASMVTVGGVVSKVGPAFCFVRLATGEAIYLALGRLAPEFGPVRVGDRLEVDYDPERPRKPGHWPRAFRARRPAPTDR